jgi:hypothetical protein
MGSRKRKMLCTALVGGAGYPLLEILWRGRTHPTMAAAGALSLCWMRICAPLPFRHSVRAALACAGVVALEGMIGLLYNRKYRIWDYRGMRGNIRGQICPQYALIWYALSYAGTFRKRK